MRLKISEYKQQNGQIVWVMELRNWKDAKDGWYNQDIQSGEVYREWRTYF